MGTYKDRNMALNKNSKDILTKKEEHTFKNYNAELCESYRPFFFPIHINYFVACINRVIIFYSAYYYEG